MTACGDAGVPDVPDPSEQLKVVTDDMWAHTLATDVTVRIQQGLPVTDLPPISFDDSEAEVELQRAFLSRLSAVDRNRLELAEQLTLDALVWETSMAIEGFEHFWLSNFLTSVCVATADARPGVPSVASHH